jgi:hypothetical protein
MIDHPALEIPEQGVEEWVPIKIQAFYSSESPSTASQHPHSQGLLEAQGLQQ